MVALEATVNGCSASVTESGGWCVEYPRMSGGFRRATRQSIPGPHGRTALDGCPVKMSP